MKSTFLNMVKLSASILPVCMMVSLSAFAAPGGQSPESPGSMSSSISQAPALSAAEREYVDAVKAVLANNRMNEFHDRFEQQWRTGIREVPMGGMSDRNGPTQSQYDEA